MTATKRFVWMDVARSFAIIFVVICHIIENQYYSVRTGKLMISEGLWYFENIFFTLGRLGVPIFLMLSGTLLLNRQYDIKTFYQKSLFPLFITTEIWTVLNYFYYCFQFSVKFELKNLIYNITFMQNSPLNHMWYMPMILGIYLVIPFLAKALKNVTFGEISLPLSVAFFAFSVLYLFNTFAGEVFPNLTDGYFVVNMGFCGSLYGMLIIIGHYISNCEILKKFPTYLLLLLFVVSFSCNTLGARFLYLRGYFHSDIFGWYTSPFIILSAVFLFELFRRLSTNNCPKIILLISKGSFAIYLMHNLVLMTFNVLLEKFGIFTNLHFVLLSLIKFAVSFGIPLIIIAIANILPLKRIKKLIFYMK